MIKLRKGQERFWSKVKKGKEDECWNWTACLTPGGYGHFRFEGKYMAAHRMSWMIHNGQIPKGEGYHGTCILHKCDNRKCVRPDHLFIGTQKDNVRDRNRKGRMANVTGENNPRSVLDENKILAIRKMYAAGNTSQRIIGGLFDVPKITISNIITRKTWQHI